MNLKKFQFLKKALQFHIKSDTEHTCVKYTYDDQNAKYRTSFISEKQKEITQAAQRKDFMYMLKHLFEQDIQHLEMWNDEILKNRFGFRQILNILEKYPRNMDILDVGGGNCQLATAISRLGKNVTVVDASVARVVNNTLLKGGDGGGKNTFWFCGKNAT